MGDAAAAAEDGFAALGIISATSTLGVRRRAAARDSWLRLAPTTNMVYRFVLRCGGLGRRQRAELLGEHHSDVLCADAVSASEARPRGPIFALAWWLMHALRAYPAATFIAKADSDVYLHLPDVQRHLLGIPGEAADFAYMGAMGFFSLIDVEGREYAFRGFAPSFGLGQLVNRKYVKRPCTRAAPPTRLNGSTARGGAGALSRCAGPFPFAFGSFFAMGVGAVGALIASPEFSEELARLHSIIPEEQAPSATPLATEDVWLGASLWRFVGSSAPMHFFSLAGEQDHLYHDDSSFRVRPYLAYWHNRNKFIGRPRILHLFAERVHCSVAIRWRPSRLLAHVRPPRRWPPQAEAPLLASSPSPRGTWKSYGVDHAYRRTGCNGTRTQTFDLSDATTLARLGLLPHLGKASYIRPEAALALKASTRARRRRGSGRRRAGGAPARTRRAEHTRGVAVGKAAAEAAEVLPPRPVLENWTRLYLYQKESKLLDMET